MPPARPTGEDDFPLIQSLKGTGKIMKNKRILWSAVAVALAVVLMAGAYLLFMPKGQAGLKSLTVDVVHGETVKAFAIQTDAAYLRGALDQQKLVSGEESAYGLFIKTADGYTADDAKQEWWCVTKDGEMVSTGVDTTPIADGDHFELTLTTGY